MKEFLQAMSAKLWDARAAIPYPVDGRDLYLWHYLKVAADSIGLLSAHAEEAPKAVLALMAEACGFPSEAELEDMERQYQGERAVREAQDEQLAYAETKGGVD